ncbi:methylthioribose-1-phosphate isomerase [Trichosporon asahii var. asahii CBS 8904]|uniref:Methylthioribose-1-phosphate isomerase n=1 Tax=Trichosporon asahii var. asahii (strain CBS 8904) TaxID=1220162 RepID=K1W897_TRIAC|nr:methylthioribose-1-phosphate isomerase [Trichosporon asahii var. asahii CBS 8904]
MPKLPEMMTSLRVSDNGAVEIIDQLRLPHEVVCEPVKTPEEAFDAIKSMKIRGAPAIASLAALAIRQHLMTDAPKLESIEDVKAHLLPMLDYLQSSRPTAVNLGEAMDRIRRLLEASPASAPALLDSVKETCYAVHNEDLARNREMGCLGAEWLWSQRGEAAKAAGKKGLKVITVCNTGSLATSGYGTAIGVITALFEADELDTAYYAQTTPYHQGSRLTSLELTTLQLPACMVCDVRHLP